MEKSFEELAAIAGFDFRSDGGPIAALLPRDRLPGLRPGEPRSEVRPLLQKLSPDDFLTGHSGGDGNMASACMAALWLANDFLDEAHQIAQRIDTPEGSYWHAIIHRREGDYANSKYWFRRAGDHPINKPILNAALELTKSNQSLIAGAAVTFIWDPEDFVDLCQKFSERNIPARRTCEQIQLCEWMLFFSFCFAAAGGG